MEARDSAGSVYPLPEVVVTATRIRASASSSPNSVVVLSQNDLLSKPGSLLANSLQGIPGLFVRSYGGGASLRSISVRGMAPEHTLLLLDGQRVNSFQNGQVDLGVIPLMGIERVEIVKGGHSPLYGADAVGGVINVFTRRPTSALTTGASFSVGSYGYRAAEASLSGTLGRFGGRLAFRNERGDGNFTYAYDDGITSATLERLGAEYRTNHAEGRLDYKITSDFETSLLVSYGEADRGVPGPITNAETSGGARLEDQAVRSRLTIDWRPSPDQRLSVATLFHYAFQEYTDPTLGLGGSILRSVYVNQHVQIAPEFEFTPIPALEATVGAELVRAWVNSNQLKSAVRWQQSVYATLRYTALLPTTVPYELALYPSLRYDHFSDVDGTVSPKIGLNLGLLRTPVLRLRASYGGSFRAPTFNDLYWFAGGNPELRPERSVSFDCGLYSAMQVMGEVSLDITYFNIDTRDRIVWMPSSGMFWSPVNVGRVVTQGVEMEGRWTGLRGALSLSLNSAWTDARYRQWGDVPDPADGSRLIYVPEQTVTATMDVRVAGIHLFFRQSWVSHRYTTRTNDRYLPSYAVASAAIRYTLPIQMPALTLKLEASNIFNEPYQIMTLYPMPLRELRGTVGVEL
ncbi:MAG: TonB-dependent receptor [Bacteroidota bacterium]